jgi:hypothetical protein
MFWESLKNQKQKTALCKCIRRFSLCDFVRFSRLEKDCDREMRVKARPTGFSASGTGIRRKKVGKNGELCLRKAFDRKPNASLGPRLSLHLYIYRILQTPFNFNSSFIPYDNGPFGLMVLGGGMTCATMCLRAHNALKWHKSTILKSLSTVNRKRFYLIWYYA